MQLHEGELVPVAAMGLAPELIGQRFLPAEHPAYRRSLAGTGAGTLSG